jgi:hypothetical protein
MTAKHSAVATPTQDDSNWRQELEYLDRLLTGRLTEPEAKAHAKNVIAKHDKRIGDLEAQIKQKGETLEAAGNFISSFEKKRGKQDIETLKDRLIDARKLRDQESRRLEAGIESAKSADRQRTRWEQLKARDKAINKAKRKMKEPSVWD